MTYQLYKPLRNHLRDFTLLESLGVIRAYLQHLQFNQAFPRDIEVDPAFLQARSKVDKHVFEWELELIAKELILNAPDQGTKDLRRWRDLSTTVNKLKDFENKIGEHPLYREIYKKNILLELYRLAHRQFPWQRPPNARALIRYFKIFSQPGLETILKAEIGLDAAKLYMLGMIFTGHFLETFGLTVPLDIQVPDLTQGEIEHFVSHFAIELADMRKRVKDSQSYDQDFAYTLNPLKMYPLVWVTLRGKQTLIAPVPTYLFRRFTEGVYYEICNAIGFSKAFGDSFQAFVGEVLRAGGADSTIEIVPESPYHIGKDRKDSVDWIISDATADVFIECKTKKLRFASKIGLAETDILNEDLDKMAGFVVQTYKTIADAKAGHYPHWKPKDRPLYPLVVTLEEWFAFGDKIVGAIDERVEKKLVEADLDPAMAKTHPYSIVSVEDLETAVQVMKRVGVNPFMTKKTEGEQRLWTLHSFMLDAFPKETAEAAPLFDDEMKNIHPSLA